MPKFSIIFLIQMILFLSLVLADEDRDFYKEEDKWILNKVDSTDNCFEEKARKKYWEKREWNY